MAVCQGVKVPSPDVFGGRRGEGRMPRSGQREERKDATKQTAEVLGKRVLTPLGLHSRFGDKSLGTRGRYVFLYTAVEKRAKTERGGLSCSFVACLSHLTIDYASLSRRSTAPTTPDIGPSNIWALITFFPYICIKMFCSERGGGWYV